MKIPSMFTEIKREVIDECYKLGLVKPNEFLALRDYLINKQLQFMKNQARNYVGVSDKISKGRGVISSLSRKFKEYFGFIEPKADREELHFILETRLCLGIDSWESSSTEKLSKAVLNTARSVKFDLLMGLTVDEVKMMLLSDNVYKKTLKVRDLGDLNRSVVVEENAPIYADKETVWAVEYILKHKEALWGLLSYYRKNAEIKD